MEEQPERFAESVLAFLADSPPAASPTPGQLTQADAGPA
jgi:hypothetical protein